MDKILLFSLCVIPSLILLYYIYIKDRIEKEPPLLLVLLFIGGVIASIISLLIELLLKNNKYVKDDLTWYLTIATNEMIML